MREHGTADTDDTYARQLSEVRFEFTCVGYKRTKWWDEETDSTSRELVRRMAPSQALVLMSTRCRELVRSGRQAA